MNMSNRIKEIKKVLDITTNELAEKINISPRTLGGYERNERKISVEFASRLSKFLNISTDWLINGKGEMFIKENESQNNINRTEKSKAQIEDSFTLCRLNRAYKYIDKLSKKHNFSLTEKELSEIVTYLANYESEYLDENEINLTDKEVIYSTETEAKIYNLCNLILNIKNSTHSNE